MSGDSDKYPIRIFKTPLDAFSRLLRRAKDYEQLVAVVRAELARLFGFTNAWLYVCEQDSAGQLVLVAAAGRKGDEIRVLAPIIPRAGDAMVEALLSDEGVVFIKDAQAGPFPEVTRKLGNRTVVNMPMTVADLAYGILGCGTFDNEPVLDLTEEQAQRLAHLANMTSIAVARLVFQQRGEHSQTAGSAPRTPFG